jgi:hypothetical protein
LQLVIVRWDERGETTRGKGIFLSLSLCFFLEHSTAVETVEEATS